MAFLLSAARRVVSAVRPPFPSVCQAAATRSYSSEPTKEKSVPYEKTLKQDGGSSGPTKSLPR